MARNRAKMREGPLAELFRATEAAQRRAHGEETAAVDQPGSSVIDRMKAPGADRTPAVTSTTIAVTATTTHP